MCSLRWKVEQFHRETKQLTGLEGYQCRKARIVRNHIVYAILVWVRLEQVAIETKHTVYHLKHGLLSNYLRQQLKIACHSNGSCISPIMLEFIDETHGL